LFYWFWFAVALIRKMGSVLCWMILANSFQLIGWAALAADVPGCPAPTMELRITVCGNAACAPGPLVYPLATKAELPPGETTSMASSRVKGIGAKSIAAGFISSKLTDVFSAGYYRLVVETDNPPGKLVISGLATSKAQKPFDILLCVFVK
jgi:hypothetical protein